MKTKCTLIGGILSLISSASNIIFNGIVAFVIWLALEIGSSLSGESAYTVDNTLILLCLLLVLLISIVNICFSSILLVKRKKRVLAIRILLMIFIFFTISINIFLIYINLASAVIIAFAIFALLGIAEFILILIDTIRNSKGSAEGNTIEKLQNKDEDESPLNNDSQEN